MSILSSIGSVLGHIGSSSSKPAGEALTNYANSWSTQSSAQSLAKKTLQTQNAINLDYSARAARQMPLATVEGLRAAGINPIVAYNSITGTTPNFSGFGQSLIPQPSAGFDPSASAKLVQEQSEADVKSNPVHKAARIAGEVGSAVSPLVSTAVGAALVAKYLKQAGASKQALKPIMGFSSSAASGAGAVSSAAALKGFGKAVLKKIPALGAAALAAGVTKWRSHRAKVGGANEKKLLNTPAHILMPLR